jgi:hypothetical protein
MDYNKRVARSVVRFFFLSQRNLPATPPAWRCPYPAANDDAWTALRWVADHASETVLDMNDPRLLRMQFHT